MAKACSRYRINRRPHCDRCNSDLGIICVSFFSLFANGTSTRSLERTMAGMPERWHGSRKHGCLRPRPSPPAATFSDLGIGLGLRDFLLNQLPQYWSSSFTAYLPCNFHCLRSVHIFLSVAIG